MINSSQSSGMMKHAVEKIPRVLSIQSHVVYGYCGNKSATFPLQLLGFEVDPINTVQFSNHTQYGIWDGHKSCQDDIKKIYNAMKRNNLHRDYSYVLTGYVGDGGFLEAIGATVRDIKANNKNCVYVCDPVLGDNGRLYVPHEFTGIYKEIILPLADVVVPNQFEAELLTGIEIKSLESAKKAMYEMHSWGIKTVVISSAKLDNNVSDHECNMLTIMASSIFRGNYVFEYVEVPRQEGNFVGTGDLFAALLTAWLHKSNNDIRTALRKTVSTVQIIIQRTLKQARLLNHGASSFTPKDIELNLIQSKADIENPDESLLV
ncbi:Pyridoxal kinase, partial [Fragariocoptes setiger]